MKNFKIRAKAKLSVLLAVLLFIGAVGTAMPASACFDLFQTASKTEQTASALVPKPMTPNQVSVNPYMAQSENSIHNDVYSSDVTNAVVPLGIYSEVSTVVETQNVQAPSAAFYDEYGNAVTPFMGGISIVDMTGDEVVRKGSFVPSRDDGGKYTVMISYSFVDSENHVVMPTSNGHIIVVETMDENGEVLSTFEKIADIDVVSEAKKVLGEDIDTRLFSIVYDYSGNLWFVTGGFRIYPNRDPAGFVGYISREYMEAAEAGGSPSADGNMFFYKLSDGESAENGIASHEEGAVILTNLACYLFKADSGVTVAWRTAYESNGANDAVEGSDYTGGGLAWGGGSTPTLTNELVLFTDNLDPINLLALDIKTGEVVAQTPVLDELDEDIPVSVENSIIVYSSGDGNATALVCNWFGAGNSGLADPDSDSSIQTYANVYDANWMSSGNKYIAPGVERVDIIKTENGYEAKKVWFRDDIRDTSMIKLCTATGYFYGYWQDMDTGMWGYEVLDYDTGETLLRQNVSSLPGYNNLAVGVIADPNGNAMYCPTGAMEMVRWQDRIAWLPDTPGKQIALSDMERTYITDAAFGEGLKAASYLNTITVRNLRAETQLAIRVNGLSGNVNDYRLFYQNADGTYTEMTSGWALTAEDGASVSGTLAAEQIYEIRFNISDGMAADLSEAKNEVRVSVILAK